MYSFMFLPFPELCLHIHLGQRKLHYRWTLHLLWVHHYFPFRILQNLALSGALRWATLIILLLLLFCLWISIVYCSLCEHFNKKTAYVGKSIEPSILSWAECTYYDEAVTYQRKETTARGGGGMCSSIWVHIGRNSGLQYPATRNYLKDRSNRNSTVLSIIYAKSMGLQSCEDGMLNSPMDSFFTFSSEENVSSRWTQFRKQLEYRSISIYPKHPFILRLQIRNISDRVSKQNRLLQ